MLSNQEVDVDERFRIGVVWVDLKVSRRGSFENISNKWQINPLLYYQINDWYIELFCI